jgi:hypothetical protein
MMEEWWNVVGRIMGCERKRNSARSCNIRSGMNVGM